MARAADEVERTFGRVHVLCNNAGIGTSPSARVATYADWDRMLSVNLGGVINGIVTFMPRIRAHGEGGHIVNTSSMAGILPLPDPGTIYTMTKFAVRGLSESLRLALAQDGIGVSVLCPGLTLTRILDDARKATQEAGADELSAGFVNAQKFAMDPLVVGNAVLEAIQRNDPYVLPHGEFVDEVRELHREIIDAFRTDLPIHPQRAAFEDVRRRMIEDLKAGLRGQ
jgi:NAD(P)-dependent dehydrogenase (short-subunit alcohol dehydrogenase family)